MMHTDMSVCARRITRVRSTHAREVTKCHQSSQAINQLSRLAIG
jgi:hypothetical protein